MGVSMLGFRQRFKNTAKKRSDISTRVVAVDLVQQWRKLMREKGGGGYQVKLRRAVGGGWVGPRPPFPA